jgi:hypothetical protein
LQNNAVNVCSFKRNAHGRASFYTYVGPTGAYQRCNTNARKIQDVADGSGGKYVLDNPPAQNTSEDAEKQQHSVKS